LARTLKTSGNQKTCHKSSKLCSLEEKKKEERKLRIHKLEIIYIQAKKLLTLLLLISLLFFSEEEQQALYYTFCE
jgi:hypothetical protein